MIRVFIAILLIALCSTLLFFSHQQLKVSLISQQDPIAAVPMDAGLIIESNKLKKSWVTLSETNLIWSQMLEDKYFKVFDAGLKGLDSILMKERLDKEIFQNKKVILSLHPGDNAIEIFAVTNAKLDVYKSLLSLLGREGFNFIKIKNQLNEFTDKNNNKCFLGYKEPFLMYSTSKMLIEQSLFQLEKGEGLLKDDGFSQINATKSFSSDVHLYFKSNQFLRTISKYLNKEFVQKWQNGEFFKGWLELDLTARPNSLMLSGLSLLEGNSLFDQSIRRQDPISSNKYNLIPSNVRSLKRYSISNVSDFIEDHKILEHSTVDAGCNCNSIFLLEELVGDEVIHAKITDKQISSNALIIKKADYKSARKTLQTLGYGDSLLINNDDHNLYKLKSNIFTMLLGVKLGLDDLYYFEKGDYVVISSINGLKSLEKDWKKAKGSSGFTNFRYYSSSYLSNFSSVDYYWKNNEIINDVLANVKVEYQGVARQFSDVMSGIDGVSFQASASSQTFNYHSYVVSTGNSTVEESNQLWVVAIDSVTREPELMKNHRSKTLEVLIQDDNNVLYLISATGKVKWSKQIEGKIIGEVEQMDIYRNGKWQMLFNTKSNIHLLDINGNEVSGFPFKLKSFATNSVNVFDYENKGNYRFLICCEDNKIYNFDKNGKLLSDWKYPVLKSHVNSSIQHFVLQNKDYLFTYDKMGHIYLLDRRGGVRYQPKVSCKPHVSQNFRLKKGVDIDNTSVVFIDSLNQIITSLFNGISDTAQIEHSCEVKQCYLSLFELGNDNLMYYSLLNNRSLSVYGADKELLFFENLDFDVNGNLNVRGKNNKYLVLADEDAQEIYLYDSDFNPTSVFSVPGSNKTTIGDVNFDGLDDVITITADGQIIAYSVNFNFN